MRSKLSVAGAADDAVDLVALVEQQLGEVGAVLAGDAGDEGGRHVAGGLLGGAISERTLHARPHAFPVLGYADPSSPGRGCLRGGGSVPGETVGTLITPARGYRTGHGSGRPLVAWQQLAVIAIVYGVYLGVRELAGLGGEARAHDNALLIERAERALDVLWEPGLQARIIGHGWLVDTIDVFYLLAHWPLIAVVAIWLYRRAPDGFRLLRNALYVSGAVAFFVFAAFPAAPPRFALAGVSDTVVARQGAIHEVLQPAGLMNEFAAMPSLHLAWNLLVCLAVLRFARGWLPRLAAALIPPLMGIAVVGTANHYVLDVAAGVAVAILGWVVAIRFAGRTRRAGPPV